MDPQNRVSNHSRPPQDQEEIRRQDPQTPKGKKNIAEKQPSDLPKAKKHKSMDSDEDDEEPQNETRASSNSQPIVPVLPLHQGAAAGSQRPAASSQGPAARANSGDEDSEFCDEYSAQSRDSGRTVLYPDLCVLINDEHWTMTPEAHKYAAAAGTFCLVTTKKENSRTYAI